MSLRRNLPITAAVAAVAVVLAACGSSGSPSGATGATKRSDAVAYSQCMRTHGVPNFPDPGSTGIEIQKSQTSGSGPSLSVNGVPISSPAFQSAMQSCRKYLPNGGHPPALNASERQAMLRFSQCIRSHGISGFPDPTFGANGNVGITFGASSGINRQSPAFQAAQNACRSILGALKIGTARASG